MVDFLQAVLPIRYKEAQELVTHDPHNNTYDYKHTYSVEIVPICKVSQITVKPLQSGHSNPAASFGSLRWPEYGGFTVRLTAAAVAKGMLYSAFRTISFVCRRNWH